MAEANLSRTERNDLIGLARRRGRVAKADAKARATELIAQVEDQLSAQFRLDDDRWSDATKRMKDAIAEVNESIRSQLQAEGLPERFHPSAGLMWSGRGEAALVSRRTELRKLAKTRIELELQRANADIDRAVVSVETDLHAVSSGEQARQHLLDIPQPETLLPTALADRVALELLAEGPR